MSDHAEPKAKTVKVPGPDHPITIERNAHRVVVNVARRVVTDTREALTLREASYPAVQYVPRKDVDMTLLAGRAIAGPHDYAQIPALVERSKLRVANFYSDMDARLAEVPFVAGEHFSAADITTLVTVDFATDVTGFTATSDTRGTLVDGLFFIGRNANQTWSVTNPDSQTLTFQVRAGDHWSVDSAQHPTNTPERWL